MSILDRFKDPKFVIALVLSVVPVLAAQFADAQTVGMIAIVCGQVAHALGIAQPTGKEAPTVETVTKP